MEILNNIDGVIFEKDKYDGTLIIKYNNERIKLNTVYVGMHIYYDDISKITNVHKINDNIFAIDTIYKNGKYFAFIINFEIDKYLCFHGCKFVSTHFDRIIFLTNDRGEYNVCDVKTMQTMTTLLESPKVYNNFILYYSLFETENVLLWAAEDDFKEHKLYYTSFFNDVIISTYKVVSGEAVLVYISDNTLKTYKLVHQTLDYTCANDEYMVLLFTRTIFYKHINGEPHLYNIDNMFINNNSAKKIFSIFATGDNKMNIKDSFVDKIDTDSNDSLLITFDCDRDGFLWDKITNLFICDNIYNKLKNKGINKINNVHAVHIRNKFAIIEVNKSDSGNGCYAFINTDDLRIYKYFLCVLCRDIDKTYRCLYNNINDTILCQFDIYEKVNLIKCLYNINFYHGNDDAAAKTVYNALNDIKYEKANVSDDENNEINYWMYLLLAKYGGLMDSKYILDK